MLLGGAMTMSGRGNGLQAAGYTVIADLDPRLADAMLEALRDAGVAAYAVPSTGERGAVLEVRLPDKPTDRLYVDRSAVERARLVLEQRLPVFRQELEGEAGAEAAISDTDAVWQSIVAAYDAPVGEAVPPWPVAEDVDDTARAPSPDGAQVDPPPTDRDEPTVARATRGPADDGDHYVPPPPPPLPRADAVTTAAWAALLGGPLLILLVAVLGWQLERWAAFLATAAFVGGFVTLVARMRDEPPTDSGPDDGAVV